MLGFSRLTSDKTILLRQEHAPQPIARLLRPLRLGREGTGSGALRVSHVIRVQPSAPLAHPYSTSCIAV
jgi:hypothetical protein